MFIIDLLLKHGVLRKHTAIEKQIARYIGTFYLNKNLDLSKEDNNYVDYKSAYRDAFKQVDDLHIHDIYLSNINNTIYIKLDRPALLEGDNKENISQLEEYIRTRMFSDKLKIVIIDDNLHDYLYPYIDTPEK